MLLGSYISHSNNTNISETLILAGPRHTYTLALHKHVCKCTLSGHWHACGRNHAFSGVCRALLPRFGRASLGFCQLVGLLCLIF